MIIQKLIKKYDSQNQFEVLKNSYKQIEFAWNNSFSLKKINGRKISNIIIAGLGGSAISGDLMQNYLGTELNIPYIVSRNYSLPSFVNSETLVIISSYSGNTEETIESFKEAIQKNAVIVCITTGGKIEEMANENDISVVKIEPGFQPRYALALNFFSLLKILQTLKVIKDQNDIVQKIISLWKRRSNELINDNNEAFTMAESFIGFIPVIYSVSDLTSAVGNRFKCQINENSKLHAFNNIIPEMNHNEIIGWETYNANQFNAVTINILDKNYHPQIIKRINITSEIILKQNGTVINLHSSENDFKVRLFDLIYLTDWISYYLALVRKQDPTTITNINILKERLAKE